MNSDKIKETQIKGYNLVELSGAGCGWWALVKATKENETRFFLGTTIEVKKYLGNEWNVKAI